MSKKCAIFNFWWAWCDAHGASLTALALYKIVEELGYDPCLIMTVFRGTSVEQCKAGRHYRFIDKYAKHSEKNYQSGEDYEELNNLFDHFIVGSDQVFRVAWVPDEWFLYSIKSEKNKIAMSASFGINRIEASEKRINRVAHYLADFSAISVREKDGIDVYNRYFHYRYDIEWIMDPVFLVQPNFYYELADHSIRKEEFCSCSKDIVFFYVLDVTPEIMELKERIAKQYDAIIIEDTPDLMAEDFLFLLTKSKMIITDSFHGLCFSIIFNRPVYCLYNILRGTSRIDTIRQVFGLDDVIMDMKDISSCDFIIPQTDYCKINAIIEKERERGVEWLKRKLKVDND